MNVLASAPFGEHFIFQEDSMASLRVALYARVSTEEQAEEGHSIEAQLREMRAVCARREWLVVQEYIDDGFRGRTLKRPRLQQLLADAAQHSFDVLMVHKPDCSLA